MQFFVLALSLTVATVGGGAQAHAPLRDRLRDGGLYKNNLSRPERIVGGWETPIEVYPHHIGIEVGEYFRCGGSILSEFWILTAAHCLAETTIDEVRTSWIIRAGTETIFVGGQARRVVDAFIHPKYDSRVFDYDVAVMRLMTPLVFSSKVSPIRLARENESYQHGQPAWICGWGYTIDKGSTPHYLRAVNVPLLDRQECDYLWRSIKITPRMVCAANDTKSICQGDSGGALVKGSDEGEWLIQIGIASFVGRCSGFGTPNAFANVGHPEINRFIRQFTN